jgi:hypothetical protein
MVDRMMRAVRADVAFYEEAESNPSLTQEAYTIVGIIAVINAVVALIGGVMAGDMGAALLGAIVSAVAVFVGYLIWSYLTYFIGTRVFNGTADVGELQRTLAYAMTPQILSGLLGLIPLVGACVGIIPALWSLYLGVVAVRQALDFDTGKAVLTTGAAWIVQFVIFFLVTSVLVGGAMGLGALTGGGTN